MHCMLETFLCHVFLLAQVQDRMPPKSVAFNQDLPEQYACYRKAHQVARWHLYIIPSLVSMCAQALYLLGLVNKSKADSVLTPGSGCPSIDCQLSQLKLRKNISRRDSGEVHKPEAYILKTCSTSIKEHFGKI